LRERNLDYKIVGLEILFLLCWMGFSPLACSGAVVWSDDFNDGNHDGWTICRNPVYDSVSNWSATNGYLQLAGSDWGIISHPSNVAYGTWSLDFKFDEAQVVTRSWADIVFISSNLDGATDDLACYFLAFVVSMAAESYGLALRLGKAKDGVFTTMDSSETLLSVAGWHHIDVTRTTTGLFSVYNNGSLILQGTDTDIGTSELFSLWAGQGLLDNVVVDDAPPIDWLPIGMGASAVVIIAVVVIFLKRR